MSAPLSWTMREHKGIPEWAITAAENLELRLHELEERCETLSLEGRNARTERDALRDLKCAIGLALGDEAGPSFAETIQRVRTERDAAMAECKAAEQHLAQGSLRLLA